jgi:hypothetical protein
VATNKRRPKTAGKARSVTKKKPARRAAKTRATATSRKQPKKSVAKRVQRRTGRTAAGRRRSSRDVATWAGSSMTTAIDAVWNQTDGSSMSNCASSISQPNMDCNCFLKNAARGFFSATQAFDDPSKDADAIVGLLADTSNGWTEIADSDGTGTQRTADAIAAFNTDNKVVIAGMTSDALGQDHGHLALVVAGTTTAGSANLTVPNCTAGSANAAARVEDQGVNFSFGKTMPTKIRYFWRLPDTSPPSAAAHRVPTRKK